MKTIQKSILTLLAAVIMTTSWATVISDDMPPSQKKELRMEITKMLESVNFKSEDVKAKLTFTITNQNVLVLLDVDCDDTQAEEAIKKNLNRKKIKTYLTNKNDRYYMTVNLDDDE